MEVGEGFFWFFLLLRRIFSVFSSKQAAQNWRSVVGRAWEDNWNADVIECIIYHTLQLILYIFIIVFFAVGSILLEFIKNSIQHVLVCRRRAALIWQRGAGRWIGNVPSVPLSHWPIGPSAHWEGSWTEGPTAENLRASLPPPKDVREWQQRNRKLAFWWGHRTFWFCHPWYSPNYCSPFQCPPADPPQTDWGLLTLLKISWLTHGREERR